jgi:hypothetical protein
MNASFFLFISNSLNCTIVVARHAEYFVGAEACRVERVSAVAQAARPACQVGRFVVQHGVHGLVYVNVRLNDQNNTSVIIKLL